eukprot:g6928.t2
MRVQSPKRRTIGAEFPAAAPASSLGRASSAPVEINTAGVNNSSKQVSPFRKRHLPSRQDPSNARSVSTGWDSDRGRASGTTTQPRDDGKTPSSWWGPAGSPLLRPIVKEGVLKKRGGRINAWGDRHFVLREDMLEQYAKGETPPTAQPKHCYVLDPSCSVSDMKESKAGGRTLFYFELGWPSMSSKEDVEEEGEGESSRSGAEGEGTDFDANGPPHSNVPTPLDSPTDGGGGRGGVVNGRGYGSEDGGMMPLPMGPPEMERVNSSSSLTGQPDLRFRRPRSNTANGMAGSATVSPKPFPHNRSSAGGEEGDEKTRNETIEGMVAAQRENETRIARLKLGELGQLSEYEREKERQKKKDGKSVINTKSQAVAATAVGVSWLTAGILTGGLVVAGTMVAAGVTVGSMGVYNKYKSTRKPSGTPGRVRVASDKMEIAEQWRQAVLDQLETLRAQPRQDTQRPAWMGAGLGLGMPGWTTRPEGPPPALKAIDLGVVDNLLANAVWASREVMHGLPVMEQEVGAVAGGDVGSGNGEFVAAAAQPGYGLGGTGPVLKTQTIVRASPLETFVALMGAPKNSQTVVVSGTWTVQCLDDHSDVVRLCLRPAWLKVAWASPRDFCVARYWHMAEDGCYIVTLSSMEHPECPVDPAFVRGEAHLVYTISPRRDSMPGGHSSTECMLACHAQVDPKGWVWNRLGFREMYMKHILMTALGVRDVIEAERFMTPRISLRSECSMNGLANGKVGVGPRSPDGSPILFEVLGAAGPECGQLAAAGSSEMSMDFSKRLGSSSLESCPPPALDRRRWTEAVGTDFMVRGPSYLTSRVKVPSAKQMFRLRAVDLFVLPEPATHLAAHPGNRVQLARKAGETSFVWVLQIMVPGPPHYAFVCYFTPGSDNWLDQGTPFGKLAKRVFLGDSDTFRDERLKLIPKIVEGNWVVKRAAGSTPAILGTKLKQHHFRGDKYLETDLEIASSSLAANITRLCTGYAKALVVDMVWTIQGNTQEELPEVALGGVRINALDLLAAQPLDLVEQFSWDFTLAAKITEDKAGTKIGLRFRRMMGMEMPAEQPTAWNRRVLFASGRRRQAREEAATNREKKTTSLNGVGAKYKVSGAMLVILVVVVLSWRRWFQRKQLPLVTEGQVHGTASQNGTDRAADLEQGRAVTTPTAEVVWVAGREEQGAMVNPNLDGEEQQRADLEMGSAAASLTLAFKEARCQTEEKQENVATDNRGEETSQGEGATPPSEKEVPALNCVRTDRLTRDEGSRAAQEEPHIDQRCAKAVSVLVAEGQRTESDVDASKLYLDEQQREAGVQDGLMAVEKPDGGGGVSPEMDPELGSTTVKSADGEGLVKTETEPMGLMGYAGVDRTEGVIQRLFVENVGAYSGSGEMVAFTKQVIETVGNNTERLTVLGELGRGKCGKVDEVRLIDFPEGSYALKTLCKAAENHTREAALVEMAVFAMVAGTPHNNVLGALAVNDTSSTMPMLLPKAAGDLESFMNDDAISLGDQLGLIVDLVKGAQHLHSLNIVHRDIKPANLLVFWTEELGLHGKLGDFGLSREINEVCPAMSGTPGFMAHECMSAEPVRGAAAHDVVAAAMVLLLVCLKKELRSPNLFANPAFMKPEEWDRLKALFHRAKNLGENVSAEMELFQVELTRRTMEDGSFAAMMLSAEQMNPALKSPDLLLKALPSFLTTDPEERQDMASLLVLVERLVAINQTVEQETGVAESVGG